MQFLLFAACHQPGLLSSYEKKNQGACRGQTFSSGPAQYHTTNRKGGHCLREKCQDIARLDPFLIYGQLNEGPSFLAL